MTVPPQQRAAEANQDMPQPLQSGRGATDPGPRNVVLDIEPVVRPSQE